MFLSLIVRAYSFILILPIIFYFVSVLKMTQHFVLSILYSEVLFWTLFEISISPTTFSLAKRSGILSFDHLVYCNIIYNKYVSVSTFKVMLRADFGAMNQIIPLEEIEFLYIVMAYEIVLVVGIMLS